MFGILVGSVRQISQPIMTPGRFVSLWMFYFGAVLIGQFVIGVVLGELSNPLSMTGLGSLLPGLGVVLVAASRLRNSGEDWPAEYGYWTLAAVFFLVIATLWVAYQATVGLS